MNLVFKLLKRTNPSDPLMVINDIILGKGIFRALIYIIILFVIWLPAGYALVQVIFLFRITPVWFYNNKPKLFMMAIVLEEILIVTMITMLIG